MKKFINILAVVAIVVFAGYNVMKAQQTEAVSDVVMANVEALGDNEDMGITCSAKCTDGVGVCWTRVSEMECRFSGKMSDRCTGSICNFVH